MKLLEDYKGKPSGARGAIYIIIAITTILASYSLYTGNDIGERMGSLLEWVFGIISAGGFYSIGAEKLKGK